MDMQTSRSREPRRANRGNRSRLTRIASLEPWARDLCTQFRALTDPRRLRQVIRCLRSLLEFLGEHLASLEEEERAAQPR